MVRSREGTLHGVQKEARPPSAWGREKGRPLLPRGLGTRAQETQGGQEERRQGDGRGRGGEGGRVPDPHHRAAAAAAGGHGAVRRPGRRHDGARGDGGPGSIRLDNL